MHPSPCPWRALWPLAFAAMALSCGRRPSADPRVERDRDGGAVPGSPDASSRPEATPRGSPVPGGSLASALKGSPCPHRRPFAGLDEASAPFALPEPFARFTPCDALAAVFADYDSAAETSASAGGVVRIDRARRWAQGGRELLAVLYYVGDDATADFICGQCRVRSHLALIEVRGAALALVATAAPWHPADEIAALFNGQAEFEPAEYALNEQESLLGVRVPWSTGMPGTWINLTLFHLQGGALTKVFGYGVDWYANGMGVDDERVASALSTAPGPKGSNDLVVHTTEERCHLDPPGPDPAAFSRSCTPPRRVGTERWRFDGKAFRRIEGRPAPLPRILHKLWGW